MTSSTKDPTKDSTKGSMKTSPRAHPGGIADLVFAGERGGRDARLAASALAVLVLYGAALGLSEVLGAPVANWSAEMAARIHDAIARERAVDLSPPPPPAPPPPAEQPPAPVAARAARPVRAAAPRAAKASPPAQAGKLTAVTSDPVDFSGAAFVVGGAATFPGGVSAAQGRGTKPGTSTDPSATGATGDAGRSRGPSRARPVSLDQAAWSCPWPAEADAEQVNEKTVVLRVRVQADGRAQSVEVLSDPGFGFGAAARACALATRFDPARDADGRAVGALSAPIRVHFYR